MSARTGSTPGNGMKNVTTLPGVITPYLDRMLTVLDDNPDPDEGIASLISGMRTNNGNNEYGLWLRHQQNTASSFGSWGIFSDENTENAPVFEARTVEGGTAAGITMNLNDASLWSISDLRIVVLTGCIESQDSANTRIGIGSSIFGAGVPVMSLNGLGGGVSIEPVGSFGATGLYGFTTAYMGHVHLDGSGETADPGQPTVAVVDEGLNLRWQKSSVGLTSYVTALTTVIDNISAIAAPTKSLRIKVDGVDYFIPLSATRTVV